MVLLIPYSHKDAAQALRLLKWIRFMEASQKTSLSEAPVYLMASKTASRMLVHGDLIEELATHFPNGRHFVLREEYEKGWPGSCNFMFAQGLTLVKGHDVMLLEPDAIPLYPNWWDTIQTAWAEREPGCEFMGNLVPTVVYAIEHMTGNAVYGKNWQAVAPKLAEVQDRTGWDVYAADQVLPRAKITPLIQHVWGNKPVSLALLSPDAVVFHQDKQGCLIAILDAEYFEGEANRVTGYSSVRTDAKIMKRFFYHPACNRDLQSKGLVFRFDVIGQFAGHWEGVFTTELESEALALEALTVQGVKEIDEKEFLEALERKKKAQPWMSLIESSEQQVTSVAAKVDQAPALLVDDPVKAGLRTPLPAEELVPETKRVGNVDDVLKLSKVVLPEPPKKKAVATKKGR